MDRVQLLVVKRLHLLDLFYQVSFLIIELVVLGTVVVEPRQKLNQLVTVTQQDFLDRTRLVRVRHKHLTTTETSWPSNCNNLRILPVYSRHTDSRVFWGHLRQTYCQHSLHRQTMLHVCSHAAPSPTVWNSLPSFVRTADSFTSFRSQLKTYMFARHF